SNEVIFALESHVKKVRQTLDYPLDPMVTPRLDGDVLLLRANQHLVRPEARHEHHFVANDYGFSELITGNCIVKELDGNHTKFLENNPDQIHQYISEYMK
ncbi:unnamed protein product, partial [Oppiella nova]